MQLLLVIGRTPFYQTLNELERVHQLVIKLEPPIFGFKQTDIKHSLTHNFRIEILTEYELVH